MRRTSLLVAVAAMIVCLGLPSGTATASTDFRSAGGDAAQPLEGVGENVTPIANFPLKGATDLQLAGRYAYVADSEGLAIIDVSDPHHPKLTGRWACKAGWGDIDISVDGNLVVMANAHGGACPFTTPQTGVVLIDTSIKSRPLMIAKIENDAQSEYVHTAVLDGDRLFLNPQVWAGYPQDHYHVPVYDIARPTKPRLITYIEFPAPAVAHDSYVDHRPDGKVLFYSSSVHTTDIFDITDLEAPVRLQTVPFAKGTISHTLAPSFDRKLLLVTDEALGSFFTPKTACGSAGVGGTSAYDVGSLHFYEAADDGTMANGGLVEAGSYNPPPRVDDGVCSSHNFWQAPHERRLVQAWYADGLRILDFSDPANPQEIGSFVGSPSTNYWGAIPHCGYIFATDTSRGLDIVRYTGEHGKEWPATSGSVDTQRAEQQGVHAPRSAKRCQIG